MFTSFYFSFVSPSKYHEFQFNVFYRNGSEFSSSYAFLMNFVTCSKDYHRSLITEMATRRKLHDQSFFDEANSKCSKLKGELKAKSVTTQRFFFRITENQTLCKVSQNICQTKRYANLAIAQGAVRKFSRKPKSRTCQ